MIEKKFSVAQVKVFFENEAKQGNRIVCDDKTVWAGLGNRSGLHGFAYELCDEKWRLSGARFLRKIDKLAVPGQCFFVQEYRHKTRDRGIWIDTVSVEVVA